MTIVELSKRMEEAKIPLSIYSLNGGLASEKHCISKQNGNHTWEVYYSERGSKSSLKIFITEEEACEYFNDWVHKTAKNMGFI